MGVDDIYEKGICSSVRTKGRRIILLFRNQTDSNIFCLFFEECM